MNFLRRHLTYANLVGTLALFLALGGAAYAATQLPRNSVGTGQLKPEAVTAGKIAKKTRGQLRGDRGAVGPAGPQGKAGAKGTNGSRGATGPRGEAGPRGPAGAAGADGAGPAYEVFTQKKLVGTTSTPVVTENVPVGAFLLDANVALEAAAPAVVTCVVTGGGEAITAVGPEDPATVSLSSVIYFGAATMASVSCTSSEGEVTVRYANLTATQVRTASRING